MVLDFKTIGLEKAIVMAVAGNAGLPVAIHAAAASSHEIIIVKDIVIQNLAGEIPGRLIGDKAYDNDSLGRE